MAQAEMTCHRHGVLGGSSVSVVVALRRTAAIHIGDGDGDGIMLTPLVLALVRIDQKR